MDPNLNQEYNKTPIQKSSSDNKNRITIVYLAVVATIVVAVSAFVLFSWNNKAGVKIKKQEKPQLLNNRVNNINPTQKCSSQKVYTSIEEALKDPGNVCRLDLTGKNLSVLPPEVSRLKNLRAIYLTSNNLTEFPPELLELKDLKEIYLPENKIKSIPPGIQNLTQLRVLNLSNNQLLSLPPEITNLKGLTTLILSSNNLTGIPDGLSLIPLQEIDLSANSFSDAEIEKIREMFPNARVFISAKLPSPPPPVLNTAKSK